MITCYISTAFRTGQFPMSTRAASQGHASFPHHRFCLPTASPPLYYLEIAALYHWGSKRDINKFQPRPHNLLSSTQKRAARATESSERERSSSSKKIRFLTVLTYTPLCKELRKYSKRKLWLLFRNAPKCTLAEPYSKKRTCHWVHTPITSKKKWLQFATLNTMGSIHFVTYIIPNSVTGHCTHLGKAGAHTYKTLWENGSHSYECNCYYRDAVITALC